MRRDYVSVGILWFVLTFIGELLLPLWNFVPPSASKEGVIVDKAFNFLGVMGLPVFAFVVSILIYSLYRFRAKGEADGDGPPIRSSAVVYLLWLPITGVLAVAILIYPGITGVAELRADPTVDLVVQVEAEQWNWTFIYPEYGITIQKADQLVLPVDSRVRFEVTSRDVVHSFWIPAFRMKVDAVPGRTTTLYLTPTKTGTFDDDYMMRLQCAELCGTGHARMRAGVTVVEQAEFEQWLADNAEAAEGGAGGGEIDNSNVDFTIEMSEYKFTPDTIRVKAGQEVRILLENKGEKEHEILIGRQVNMEEGVPGGFESDLFDHDPSLVQASGSEGFHQGSPEEIADEGYHVELEPGATGTLVFTIPASKAGEWEMGCFIDDGQHYEEGMHGTLIVEQ